MRPILLLLAVFCAIPSPALATWSVIAVDKATGRVVISSATCVDRDDQFLMGVQAVVVPGKGVAAGQAGADGTHNNGKDSVYITASQPCDNKGPNHPRRRSCRRSASRRR